MGDCGGMQDLGSEMPISQRVSQAGVATGERLECVEINRERSFIMCTTYMIHRINFQVSNEVQNTAQL